MLVTYVKHVDEGFVEGFVGEGFVEGFVDEGFVEGYVVVKMTDSKGDVNEQLYKVAKVEYDLLLLLLFFFQKEKKRNN